MPTAGRGKQYCTVCKRNTWRIGGHCGDHSEWSPRVAKDRSAQYNATLHGVILPDAVKLSERELRTVGRMDMSLWQRSIAERNTRVTAPEFADLFEPDAPALPADKRKCSFCGSVVDLGMAQSEKQVEIKKVDKPYIDSDGKVDIRETIQRKVAEMHACPNCVTNIRKPIVARIV